MRNLFLILVLLFATPLFAVEPDEILDDPVLEQRARDISKGLRCLVCRNENIDSSNAGIAKDLRLLVRERLVAGDSNTEAVDFIVDRYGEYVLLKPRMSRENAVLYLTGPVLLVLGAIGAFLYLRRRSRRPSQPQGELSREEAERLAQLLKD
ncbi:cytochrome c-type biogenesis protein [Neptunicoccus cionae]|uniref:cytochrome c-type biogenesis protein n=1 Tax=Neptunicoccus cionae TaxID=2035344 RepID=UPI000C75CD26|nr:cytochrome c-type biogenesis protein [Amylibacter cionae]PLS20544.1 cytochrome C biogenesis protein CcdA [Amylibacter cionae]